MTSFGDPDELKLKKHVFIGYSDIAAAGCRTLLGIDMRVECYPFCVPGLETCLSSCVLESSPPVHMRDLSQFQVLHCKYEEYSLIVVNAVVPAEKCHLVSLQLMKLLRRSPVQTITVISALRLDIPERKFSVMYENCYCGKDPDTKYPPLPAEIRTSDVFLSLLIQFLRVESIPTSLFICPAMRAVDGPASDMDGSYQLIEFFQNTINGYTKLRFNVEEAANIIYKDCDMTSGDAELMYQ